MKTTRFLSMAALALIAAACSNNDLDIDQQEQVAKTEGITITATLAPKGGADTRAVADNGDNQITVSWQAGETLAILYNNGTEASKSIATVGTVAGDGSAPITFTVDASTPDSAPATIIYPADAAMGDNLGVKPFSVLMANQVGALSASLDVRVGAGTIEVKDPGKLDITTQPAAQYAIAKFTLTDGTNDINATSFVVKDGTDNIITTVTPASATNVLYVALPPATGATYKYEATDGTSNYSKTDTGKTLAASTFYQPSLTLAQAAVVTDLSTLTANHVAQNGETLTGVLDVANYPVKISIADGATITLDGVTINGVHNNSYQWAGLHCEGDATIILKDGSTNTVKGFHATYPGVFVPSGKTLIIKGETLGTGKLIASSNSTGDDSGAAGIGGGDERNSGNIEIQGGDITATGSKCNPGIGSGYEANCGTITISGGTIKATGGSGQAAGIGSGWDGSSCGNITITGGSIDATGGGYAAGIGSGADYSSCGTITITDGVTLVKATKGGGAPYSIGAGNNSSCGTVTIGGVVGAITTSPYTYPAP